MLLKLKRSCHAWAMHTVAKYNFCSKISYEISKSNERGCERSEHPSSAIFGNIRQYSVIFGNIQKYSAIFGKIPQKCGFCLNVRAATVVIGTHKVSLSITEQLLDVCVSLEAFWASTTKKIRSFFDAPIGTREPKILGFLGQDGPKNREKH